MIRFPLVWHKKSSKIYGVMRWNRSSNWNIVATFDKEQQQSGSVVFATLHKKIYKSLWNAFESSENLCHLTLQHFLTPEQKHDFLICLVNQKHCLPLQGIRQSNLQAFGVLIASDQNFVNGQT